MACEREIYRKIAEEVKSEFIKIIVSSRVG